MILLSLVFASRSDILITTPDDREETYHDYDYEDFNREVQYVQAYNDKLYVICGEHRIRGEAKYEE